MNYKDIYQKIINNAKIKNNIKEKYYEIHHIIPKCLGGNNEPNNLVNLTLKEHYICHKLLCYIYPENKSLAHAYWMMTITTIGAMENIRKDNLYIKDCEKIRRIRPFLEGESFNISAREYEWCREHWRKLTIGIKRTDVQRERISNRTKQGMQKPEVINKCRYNKDSKYYYEINTGIVHKWFPGDNDIDLTKYKWGRGPLSIEQKNKLSKTQKLNKTLCKIGKTNFRYCWYKDFIKDIPNFFIDLHQKQNNKLKKISNIILQSVGVLKDKGIFIQDDIIFKPLGKHSGLTIITPSVYEVCLDLLNELNINDIANCIYKNINIIKELNKKYLNM
jgi:hypothetical protein